MGRPQRRACSLDWAVREPPVHCHPRHGRDPWVPVWASQRARTHADEFFACAHARRSSSAVGSARRGHHWLPSHLDSRLVQLVVSTKKKLCSRLSYNWGGLCQNQRVNAAKKPFQEAKICFQQVDPRAALSLPARTPHTIRSRRITSGLLLHSPEVQTPRHSTCATPYIAASCRIGVGFGRSLRLPPAVRLSLVQLTRAARRLSPSIGGIRVITAQHSTNPTAPLALPHLYMPRSDLNANFMRIHRPSLLCLCFAGQRITLCVYSSSPLNLPGTSRATSPKRAPQTQCSQLSSWLRA